MSEKKRWIVLAAGSLAVAAGLGALVYMQRRHLDESRDESSTLAAEIARNRELVGATPELEKEVILQRETDVVIRELLSDDEDVNNLVRTLQTFARDSGLRLSSVKKQNDARGKKGAKSFQQVAYTLNFEADAFQLMEFLNRVESHSRFMSVTGFKLDAARRKAFEDSGDAPMHSVTLDVETYVYAAAEAGKDARIDGYERKRDLLVGEIADRAEALRLHPYHYRGPRGRRDPWIDPRIPVIPGGVFMSIEDQITLVDTLVELADDAEDAWREMDMADNLIAEMKKRAQLEKLLADLEEEVRRVDSGGVLVFAPAKTRFDKHVLAAVADLRAKLESHQGTRGPSVASLREAADGMRNHLSRSEYELALEAFEALSPNLGVAEADEVKRPLVEALRELERLASTVLEFERIEITIDGVAIDADFTPVALINGRAVAQGELVGDLSGPPTGDELLVQTIRENEIDFVYRGVVIARRFDPSAFGSQRGDGQGAKSGKNGTNQR